MNASRRGFSAVTAAVFLCALGLAAAALLPSPAGSQDTDCDIDRGPCAKPLGGTGITAAFELLPRPVQAMKALSCRLEIKRGESPVTDRSIRVTFSMPGMSMAENTVVLRHAGGGLYEGNAVIVRCPSGRKVWRAEARVARGTDGDPHPALVSYTFRLK